MIRPNDYLAWYQMRAQMGKHDLAQLVDGLSPGGTIVVGGSEINVQKTMPILSNVLRIGKVQSMANAVLDPNSTTTFDSAAIAQFILIAKNEAFHEALNMCVGFLEKQDRDGTEFKVALQRLQAEAEKIQRL